MSTIFCNSSLYLLSFKLNSIIRSGKSKLNIILPLVPTISILVYQSTLDVLVDENVQIKLSYLNIDKHVSSVSIISLNFKFSQKDFTSFGIPNRKVNASII